jgi:hypothetical protein
MTRPRNAPAYEDDFAAWLEDQAGRARRGEVEGLDLENIAEELEGMARSDRREIRTRLTVLLVHLLKDVAQPRRCSSSWLATIGEQPTQITTVIDDSASLQSFPAAVLEQCYAEARSRAAVETRSPESAFSEHCPFELALVLGSGWLPS